MLFTYVFQSENKNEINFYTKLLENVSGDLPKDDSVAFVD
jgi:hypothetical protein